MKPKGGLITLALLLALGLSAENASSVSTRLADSLLMDSVERLIAAAKHDTDKIHILNSAGEEVINSSTNLALSFEKRCLAISEKALRHEADPEMAKLYTKLMANTLNDVGYVLHARGDVVSALDYYSKALSVFKDLGDSSGAGMALINIGFIYNDQGDFPGALRNFFRSLSIFERLNDQHSLSFSLMNIGYTYASQNDHVKAMEYYKQCLTIREKAEDWNGFSNTLLNIGASYSHLNDNEKALEYYLKALRIADSIGDDWRSGTIRYNIARLFLTQGEEKRSVSYCKKALQFMEQSGNEYDVFTALITLGTAYLHLSNLDSALEITKKGAQYADALGIVDNIKQAHELLSQIYAAKGDFIKTLSHYKLYARFKDSLSGENKYREFGKLETNHELQKAAENRKLLAAEAERSVREKTSRRDNLQYSGILIFLVIIFAAIFASGHFTFPVPVVGGLTFFAFLLFFEFCLVLLDPLLERFSNSEPAYKLLFNAILAAAIFPIHSFFETTLKKRVEGKMS